MLNTGCFLDSSFLIGPPMDSNRCSLFWDHISMDRTSWDPREVDTLIFGLGKSKKNKDFNQPLYSITDFYMNEVYKFIEFKIQGRDNFLLVGNSDVGKTQLVNAHLYEYFRTTSRYLVVSTREELKLVTSAHHSIIF